MNMENLDKEIYIDIELVDVEVDFHKWVLQCVSNKGGVWSTQGIRTIAL